MKHVLISWLSSFYYAEKPISPRAMLLQKNPIFQVSTKLQTDNALVAAASPLKDAGIFNR